MDKIIKELKEKADKHLNKIEKHKPIKEDLEMEYKALKKDDKHKEKVGEQLLTTLLKMKYHEASAKTYLKTVTMLEKRVDLSWM